MAGITGSEIVAGWPEESRDAARLVMEKYGEPHEATESLLTWHRVGPWKRIVASKAFWRHDFPAPHYDSVESVLDYFVPTELYGALADFDGSVVAERTAGEISARCHDEEANNLALNLVDDIVTGERSVDEARAYYAQEFLDYRRKRPTPYMEALRFELDGEDTTDPDERIISHDDLQAAVEDGRLAGQRAGQAA